MCLHGIMFIKHGQLYLFLCIQSGFHFIRVSLMSFCAPWNIFHWILHDTIFRTVDWHLLYYCHFLTHHGLCVVEENIMAIHIKHYHHSSLISFKYLSFSSIFQSVQIIIIMMNMFNELTSGISKVYITLYITIKRENIYIYYTCEIWKLYIYIPYFKMIWSVFSLFLSLFLSFFVETWMLSKVLLVQRFVRLLVKSSYVNPYIITTGVTKIWSLCMSTGN